MGHEGVGTDARVESRRHVDLMPFVYPAPLNITTCETRLTRFVRQLRRECVRLFSLAVLFFFAGQLPNAAHANGKREVPLPLTMHEKVVASDLIFIGEAPRVFFTAQGESSKGTRKIRFTRDHG